MVATHQKSLSNTQRPSRPPPRILLKRSPLRPNDFLVIIQRVIPFLGSLRNSPRQSKVLLAPREAVRSLMGVFANLTGVLVTDGHMWTVILVTTMDLRRSVDAASDGHVLDSCFQGAV